MACTTSATRPQNSITTSSSCRSGHWPAMPFTARCAAAGSGTGFCLASRSGYRCGRNISSWCSRFRSRVFILFDERARKSLATPGPYIAAAVALQPWRRISSGWCRTTSCRSAMPSTAPCRRAAGTTISGIRLQFAIGQLFFLMPSAADRHAAVYPAPDATEKPSSRPTPSTGASSPGWPSARL